MKYVDSLSHLFSICKLSLIDAHGVLLNPHTHIYTCDRIRTCITTPKHLISHMVYP